jgi:hypothetical protein
MSQLLAEHTWPLGQAMPQPPQFDGSFTVLTQAVPHFVVPPAQTKPHIPPEQT